MKCGRPGQTGQGELAEAWTGVTPGIGQNLDKLAQRTERAEARGLALAFPSCAEDGASEAWRRQGGPGNRPRGDTTCREAATTRMAVCGHQRTRILRDPVSQRDEWPQS